MAHGEPLHTVFLYRDEQVGVLVLAFHLNGHVFRPGHGGDGGAVDIGIGHTYLIPQPGQGNGQVHRDGAFAHAAFSGGDANDVAHLPQLLQVELNALGGRFGRFLDDGIYLNLRSAGQVPVQTRLHRTHQVVFERVRTLGEAQCHVDGVIGNMYLFHQPQSHHILVLFGRMLHLLQPQQYFFLVHAR